MSEKMKIFKVICRVGKNSEIAKFHANVYDDDTFLSAMELAKLEEPFANPILVLAVDNTKRKKS